MEERNKIFGFVLRDGRVVEGSVLSRFQDIKDLEQIKAEAMDSDFITVVNQYGNKAILSKYQINMWRNYENRKTNSGVIKPSILRGINRKD